MTRTHKIMPVGAALLLGAATLLTGCASTDPGPSPDLYQKQVEFQKSQVPGPKGESGAGGEMAARQKSGH